MDCFKGWHCLDFIRMVWHVVVKSRNRLDELCRLTSHINQMDKLRKSICLRSARCNFLYQIILRGCSVWQMSETRISIFRPDTLKHCTQGFGPGHIYMQVLLDLIWSINNNTFSAEKLQLLPDGKFN